MAFEAVTVDALRAVLLCEEDALDRLEALDDRFADVSNAGLGEAIREACAPSDGSRRLR